MDKDGTLFGQPTTILPQSEWQWDKNALYGIGNAKIPARMTAHPDGTSVVADKQWPRKGIHSLFVMVAVLCPERDICLHFCAVFTL